MDERDLERLSPDANQKLVLQTIVRSARVQEAVGQAGRPLSLAEIAAATGIDRSATQRIAHTLESLGYFERALGGNGFRPGQRTLDRSFEYLSSNPLVERAMPVLNELRKSARERVDLSLFDGRTIVYAARLQSKRETFYATLIGRRIPAAYTSGGRAMLALLPITEAQAILAATEMQARTPRSCTDRGEMMKKLDRARHDGYALVQEEWLMGEIALAAAIRDATGRPVAAVHVAGSLSDWSETAFRERFAPLVMEAAATLTG